MLNKKFVFGIIAVFTSFFGIYTFALDDNIPSSNQVEKLQEDLSIVDKESIYVPKEGDIAESEPEEILDEELKGPLHVVVNNGRKVGNTTEDKEFPKITAIELSTIELTNQDVIVTVTATDNIGVTGYSFNGGAWQTENTFRMTTNGKVEIEVRDAANNITDGATEVTNIDKIRSSVEVSNPIEGSVVKAKELKANVKATDNVGISKITIHLYKNGALHSPFSMLTDGGPEYTHERDLSTLNLEDGNYFVKANALDKTGSISNTVTRNFVVDSTKPTVKVNLNRSSYINSGDAVRSILVPEIEANDTNLSAIKVLNASGKEVTSWNNLNVTSRRAKINWLGNGTYTIIAIDKAGNESEPFVVTIDNVSPTLEVLTPTEGSFVKASELKANVKATDNVGISKITVHLYKNGALHSPFSMLTDGGTEYSHERDLSTLNLEDGNYFVKANALDKAGSISNTVTKNFVVDSTKPTVKVNLNRASYINSGDAVMSASIPEIEANDTNLSEIKILNSLGKSIKTVSDLNVTSRRFKINWLGNGTYTIIAIDKAGNESDSFSVTIDNVIPTAELNYSTTLPTNQNVLVTLTVSEKIQNLVGWIQSTSNELVWTKEYANNVTGEVVTFIDLAGNSGNVTVTIGNIDKIIPEISFEKNSKGIIQFFRYEDRDNGRNIYIPRYVVSDNYDDVSDLEVIININYESKDYNLRWLGTYRVTFAKSVTYVVTDRSGNSSEPLTYQFLPEEKYGIKIPGLMVDIDKL